MRAKILILGLILLTLISCQKGIENPHSNNPSGLLDPPTINYFTATYNNSTAQGGWWSSNFTLSWSVSNATTVSIDQGIGEVLIHTDTCVPVGITETTTYTLTATNDIAKKTASCMAEPPEHVILEITTIPELPVFCYSSSSDNSISIFTFVITEVNGIGGYFKPSITFSPWSYRNTLPKQTIEPFESLSIPCTLCAGSRPTSMTLWLEGWDNNKCEIDMQANIPFIFEN